MWVGSTFASLVTRNNLGRLDDSPAIIRSFPRVEGSIAWRCHGEADEQNTQSYQRAYSYTDRCLIAMRDCQVSGICGSAVASYRDPCPALLQQSTGRITGQRDGEKRQKDNRSFDGTTEASPIRLACWVRRSSRVLQLKSCWLATNPTCDHRRFSSR